MKGNRKTIRKIKLEIRQKKKASKQTNKKKKNSGQKGRERFSRNFATAVINNPGLKTNKYIPDLKWEKKSKN